ncbi:filaggrin-2-like [Leptidea sinapis]|uniref:filaggrin-2-like n=1 Tax=Leptidea sinapis TaxID=189913 RepID=UPI002126B83B|nr:filaggrin-2-like [Leptidea sinapis]
MGTERKFVYLYFIAITSHGINSMSTKEVRTSGLLSKPEKFINGVIDIVQSHKNKPYQQGYAPNYQQYPGYQQWNYQNGNLQNQANFQNQAFSLQGQGSVSYQNGYNQMNIPQGQTIVIPAQGFSVQNPSQQYQIVYQNVPQSGQFQGNGVSQQSGQYSGSQISNQQNTGQYQGAGFQGSSVQGSTGQYQSGTGQYQSGTGQYQGTAGQFQGVSGQYQGNNGIYHGSSGQYQGSTGQYHGSENFQGTGNYQGGTDNGQMNGQGFLVAGGQDGNQGQTCVCQWTKPRPNMMLSDPIPDKNEKIVDDTPQIRNLISF